MRTAPPREDDRRFGISLLVVDADSPGHAVDCKLDEVGLRTSDTAELSFTNVMVPADNLLGGENQGFAHLGRNLRRERLSIAIGAYAQAKVAIRLTAEYARQRPHSASRPPTSRTPGSNWPSARPNSTRPRQWWTRALEAHDRGQLSAADAP